MTGTEFKSTVLPLRNAMYSIAFLILRNEDDAADTVQDTVLKLWQRRALIQPDGNLKGYCLSACRNNALSLIRDRHECVPVNDSTDTCTEPDRHIEYRERLSMVEKAMTRLPENQRTVIMLSSYSDCSNEEIAEITGMTNVNVRALLSRGRKRLREILLDTMR